MKLHMDFPIWVWLYDYGSLNYSQVWRLNDDPDTWSPHDDPKLTHPQAHTYAFLTEKEAREHPAKVNWPKNHKYVLQKTYLQTE